MNKLLTFMFIGLFLFSLTSVSAFIDSKTSIDLRDGDKYTLGERQIDYKEIWKEYKPIEITTWFGLGTTIFNGALVEHTSTCGGDVNCLSEIEIYLDKKSILIEEMIFERSFDDGKTWVRWNGFVNWNIQIENKNRYVEQDTYSYVCEKTGKLSINGTAEELCSQVKTGTETIDTGEWKPYQVGTEVEEGNYKIRILGNKKSSTLLDWKIRTQGKVLDELAVWGTIGVGGATAEVTLNSPANNSIQYTNLVTFNASANVTNGAYLVNASLNQSVNGGAWEVVNTTNIEVMSGDDLVSYYKLDETSGTTAYDSVGDNNGTISGATINQAGKINKSYNFDTNSDNIALPFNIIQTTTTLTGWFNVSTEGLILSSCSGSFSSSSGITSGYDLRNTGWHFFTAIRNSTGMFLYLDGNYVGTAGGSNTCSYLQVDSSGKLDWRSYNQVSSSTSYIGKPPVQNGLIGYIDEVGIWNRTLTSTEITQLYNSGAGSRPTTTTTTTTTFTNTYSAGDVVDWNMKFCDADGDCGQAVSDFRFTIDPTAPTITLNYPTALIDYGKLNGTLQLNFTATDDNLDKVWYNYNGTNVTIDGEVSGVYNVSNITLSTKKNVTIYANDTAGNLKTTTFSWDYKVFENSLIYNNLTRAGDQEDYSLNLTLNPAYDLTSAIFHFDGFTSSPSIFSSGNNRILNITNYQAPIYTIDTNVSVWFDLVLNDLTEIHTINRTQLVEAIFLDNCSSYTNVMFNISLFDEISQTPINGDIQFSYNLLNFPAYQIISTANLSLTNRTNFAICSDVNLTNQNYVQSIEIRYQGKVVNTTYVPELYHIQRAAISPNVTKISLFSLNQSESTEFKITYQDDTFNFVEGAIVQLLRKYISEDAYKVVEAPITSSEGIAVLHIDLDSIKYKAIVIKNGIILDTFDNLVFKCQSELAGECEQKLLGNIDPQNSIDYDTERDFSYSVTPGNNSISVTYSVPSSSPASVNIVLTQKDEWGNITSCNKTVLSSGGSIECDYDTTLGVSYLELTITKDGSPIAYNTYIIDEETGLDFLDNNYIIVVVLMLSLVGMALSSPEWIVINGIMTLLLSGMLWLVNGINFVAGLGILMWLVIAAGILILKLSKQEDK